jgi:tetratricopeptide (TPR) repeat protein
MNRDKKVSSYRKLSRRNPIPTTKPLCRRPWRVLQRCIHIAACFAFIFSPAWSFGQNSFESYLAEAVSAQSAGDTSAAVSAYQRALAIRHDVPEVWANLGLMQHQLRDYAGALKSFRAANQLQPKLFVPLLFLGIENLQLGNKTDAIRYLLMAQQIHTNDAEIYMNLGRAYFDLRKFEDASAAYRRTTELNTKNGEAWYRLGITYLEMSEAASGELAKLNRQSPYFLKLHAESLDDQDKLAEATEVYRKQLSNPNVPQYAYQCTRSAFGLLLLRSDNLSEAQTEFQKDVSSGGCLLGDLGLIRASLAKGQTEEAIKALGSLWSLDSGFVSAHASLLTRGMTAAQLGIFDRALAQPETAAILPAEEITVLQMSLRGGRTLSLQAIGTKNLGSANATASRTPRDLYMRGEYGKCERALLPALSTLTREKIALLAACSFYTGDFKTTVAAAKRLRNLPQGEESGLYWSVVAEQRLAVLALAYAVEVEPNSIRLHELLAESYRDREKYTEAEAEYNVALSINPNDFAALVGAATNYLQELKIDPAREMIQSALVQNPSDPEANYIMGEVLIAKHTLSDAEPYLLRGLAARAQLIPRIHALLGQIYAAQGDTSRAIVEYKLGLSSDDDGSVHFQLGRLYQKAGESALAADAFATSKSLVLRRHGTVRDMTP